MIGSTRQVTVWAYGAPADLRKGFDGLSALVSQGLARDPLSGDCYLFVNAYLFWAIDVSGTARVSTGAQCRIPIIASHPEHPFPAPENLAAKGVRERKRSVPRLSRVPNPAKRLKVVQRPETVYRLLTPRRD